MTDEPDILIRLQDASTSADDMPIVEVEALLKEAAGVIETLRTLVGIRQEIALEEAEPDGKT